MLGWKQDALASAMGDPWNQKKISLLEQKETIDNSILEEVAKILKISPDAIKSFNDDTVVNYFNNFNDHSFSHSNGTFSASQCTFNPLDKLVELIDDNKKLYEALLREKDEKIALLERLTHGQQK